MTGGKRLQFGNPKQREAQGNKVACVRRLAGGAADDAFQVGDPLQKFKGLLAQLMGVHKTFVGIQPPTDLLNITQ